MLTQQQRQLILSGAIQKVSVKDFGLRGRAEVYLLDSACVWLITRSSRFLGKDAETFATILEAASTHEERPLTGCILIEKAPVCSKARRWLEDKDISLETLYS